MSHFEMGQQEVLFQDSLRKLFREHYDFQKRAERIANKDYFSEAIWKELAQLGVLALMHPAEYQGLAGSQKDLCAVMEVMGEFLLLEPFLEYTLGAMLLCRYGHKSQKQELLPLIGEGRARVVFIPMKDRWSHCVHKGNKSVFEKTKDGFVINGSYQKVVGFPNATHAIIESCDAHGNTLYALLECDKFAVKAYSMVDDRAAADARLEAVSVTENKLLVVDDAKQCNQWLFSVAAASLAAEAVAIMQQLNNKTRTYTKQREQFGRPLSKFQALSHCMVEMFLQEEECRSMRFALACALDSKEHRDTPYAFRLALQVKLKVNKSSQYIGEESVQLHGGMGVSDEVDIAHYFRRLTCMRWQYGDDVTVLECLLPLRGT